MVSGVLCDKLPARDRYISGLCTTGNMHHRSFGRPPAGDCIQLYNSQETFTITMLLNRHGWKIKISSVCWGWGMVEGCRMQGCEDRTTWDSFLLLWSWHVQIEFLLWVVFRMAWNFYLFLIYLCYWGEYTKNQLTAFYLFNAISNNQRWNPTLWWNSPHSTSWTQYSWLWWQPDQVSLSWRTI